MCGIVGIVRFDPRETVEAGRVRRMRDALRHRGPDGAGVLVDGPVALGHRRLAIVDVAGGHQPMSNEDGSVWIVFNGEVYNHASLRPGLERLGHRYRTRSDTETILHLYEEEGERCVERLAGMFAFAIWDARLGSLLLARDRLGIKPLYYAAGERELCFASEVKGILAAGSLRPALNTAALPAYLANRYVPGEETLFDGVRALPPGHTQVWRAGGATRRRRYWSIPAARPCHASVGDAAAALRARLGAAVRSHLMSDVPLGLFLSGGVDSSGLLGLMSRETREPVRTFAVGFAEREANELAYGRLAARAHGALHSEVVVEPGEFFAALPRLVWHEDQPIAFPSSVPLYFVSRLASQAVKVVLTGEGADELFLGYNRYRVTAWNERLGRLYNGVAPASVRGAVRGAVPGLPPSLRRYASRSFLGLEPGPRGTFFENFAVFPDPLRRRLLREPRLLEERDPFAFELRCYEEAGGELLDRVSRADMQSYLVRLLMKQDQMSMAASLESRVPFLDHELVEHVAALPSRYKLRGLETKAVLRAALRGLVPEPILGRPKMGFPVPIGSWFRGRFFGVVEEFVLSPRALESGLFQPDALRRLAEDHRSGAAQHADRLWLLVNLEIWRRVFLDGEDVGGVMRAA
jgi:asparagine synthase (glutamine-hydrolysing)